MNTLTTQHAIRFSGLSFVIKGEHELRYRQNSKMMFFVYLGTRGRSVRFGQLREAMEHLINETAKAEVRQKRHDFIRSLSTLDIIKHPDFAYARFQPSGLGNYYNLYWRSSESPTGIELAGGCSEEEWERLSKLAGKQTQYLSPTENRCSAK